MMNDKATEGGVIQVRDSAGVKEFVGVKISDVSTEQPDLPRWTMMALYRMTDGSGRYVLSVVGRSVVYHQYGGPCNSGVRTAVEDLIDDAEPCRRCDPVDDEGVFLDDVVALEEDRYTVHVCEDAKAVIARLRHPRNSGSRSVGTISGPGQRLIGEAASRDEGIRNALMTVERL